MFLDKDLPIIGSSKVKYGDIFVKLLTKNMLKNFSKPRPFPGDSPILDAKGVPYRKEGTGTVKFRRYEKLR